MRVAVDFDNTLAVMKEDGSIGGPVNSVVEAVKTLKERGNEIYIFSGRDDDEVKAWLEKEGIVYDGIISQEEAYVKDWQVFIDDLAVNPVGLPADIIVLQVERIGKANEAYQSRRVDKKPEGIQGEKPKESKFPSNSLGGLLEQTLLRRQQLEEADGDIVEAEVRKEIIKRTSRGVDLVKKILGG